MPTKKSNRKHCRICSGLATVSSDICHGCRMAEVRKHITSRKRSGEAKKQVVQEAYSASLATLPAADRPSPSPSPTFVPNAIFSSVATGLGAQDELHSFGASTLANAQRFAATLGGVPTSTSAAQMFFSYSQRTFYSHIRAMLLSLSGTKKLPGKKRKVPSVRKIVSENTNAQTETNILLAKALRFIRIYMQMELIPLALKIGCSSTLIYHLEAVDVRISPKWVEQYARVFCLTEDNIYAYAVALGEGPAARGDASDMVQKFVAICLASQATPYRRNKFAVERFKEHVFARTPHNTQKLQESDVINIRARIAEGISPANIARDYNVSRSAVLDIRANRTWTHV